MLATIKQLFSSGVEYQVVKRGRNIMALRKNVIWKKGKEEAISSSLEYIRLLGRISSGGGDGYSKQDFKNVGVEEY